MEKDIKEFHNLHPHKKLKILGIIALIFAISIGFGLSVARRAPLQRPNTAPAAQQGGSMLSIVPESATVARGASTKVSVKLEGAGSQATDVVITFDPKVVKVSNIVNGDVFPDILRSDVSEKQLVVSAAVDPNKPNDVKTGTLFSFTLQGVRAGTTSLAFDKDVTITATNGVNTLGAAEPVSITVQ